MKLRRIRSGLSIRELSAMVSVSTHVTLHAIERAKFKKGPTFALADKLSVALNWDLKDMARELAK